MTLVLRELDLPQLAAAQFVPAGRPVEVWAYGNGNINKTYMVQPQGEEPFLLQRLNTQIFERPELVMRNMRLTSQHLERRGSPAGRRWEAPHVLPTRSGDDHWRAADGSYWRALRYIGRSRAIDTVADAATAREVGQALGTFHALVADLPIEELADTLPGFHVAPGYLARYDEVARAPETPEEEWCARFIAAHRDWVPVLEDAREAGRLRLRPIHGDPKVNNILFDEGTGAAIAMVDWDTIKPGLVQYDIGDCLRSACNPDGEDAPRWQDVRFDLALGSAALGGYLGVARHFFDPADFDLVPEAARLIAFELGLRFFTDHLAGDVYFHVTRRGQNLSRALVQLTLAQSIHAQLDDLRAVVDALR